MSGNVLARCREDGCIQDALLHSGLCSTHTEQLRRKRNLTSDGVRGGKGHPKITDEQAAEMRRMWSGFKTVTEIGRHFGVDAKTVRKYLRS